MKTIRRIVSRAKPSAARLLREPLPDATGAYLATAASTADASTYTFSGQSLGAAATKRCILVGVVCRNANAISGVTIAGIAAKELLNVAPSANQQMGFWMAVVPTGTTGDIVVTCAGEGTRCAIATWSVRTYRSRRPVYAVSAATGSLGVNTALGSFIACLGWGRPDGANQLLSAADYSASVAQTPRTISIAPSAGIFAWTNATVRSNTSIETSSTTDTDMAAVALR